MELSGRPLLDTKPDRELFAGRDEELEQLAAHVERRLNVLLIGERGTGKTSLLRQVAYELRQRHPDQPPPGFVEGRLAENAKTFLDLVRYRLGLSPALLQPSAWQEAIARMGTKPVLDDTLELPRLVASLRDAAPEGKRVVLVDEVSSKIGQTLFGRLRDEMWQLPLTWVVATADSEAGPLLSPPADAFFDVVMHLEPLSSEGQRMLLEARAGRRGRQIARQLDEGNPRRLLALAREAVQGGAKPGELAQAQSERDAQVSRLGRSASMLMAELESLGPVSASDDKLLRRLGWTRARAVQVLRGLEEQGLVTSSTVKGDAGRPRKVYRPVELTEETDSSKPRKHEPQTAP
jgi:DNA-binding MarR family transcriptional regulator